jgi:hypothetical protein
MKRVLSGLLTAATVLAIVALVLIQVTKPFADGELNFVVGPLSWTLGGLVVIRLLLTFRRLRSGVAAPIADSATAQSRFFGYTPATSKADGPGKPPYTTSRIEDDSQRENLQGGSH